MAVDHDMQPHLDTWHSFVRIAFYCLAGVLGVIALMALFLL